MEEFAGGVLEDARLFGDGYDFQVTLPADFMLVDVKGVWAATGGGRLTANEYAKAEQHKQAYYLAVVSNLVSAPQITLHFDPLASMEWTMQQIVTEQTFYTTSSRRW